LIERVSLSHVSDLGPGVNLLTHENCCNIANAVCQLFATQRF
jgi:hypothetical protein